MSAKLKQVTIRFEPEVHEKLQERAKADHRSLPSLVRLIVGNGNASADASASEVR